ncbi:flagellar hook-basal body complex protein FliE [Clostridium cellulovorans]|uniref:Flagellar hook-basal body complex protein FliE n=1 Tax=Clostridium cellulovorans (strain ATCC 35296 / DSM 3052 / OCM 3 / 743B) TaxID=573061 RepID=D9SKG1_CLOC7|nr:flagellar hook-basal body complex protein FliE [Clostridium cellulovorans]ADL51457.1 flagellar hook-basal body complex subunit FliE [Clostridium cellulovorans 743B]
MNVNGIGNGLTGINDISKLISNTNTNNKSNDDTVDFLSVLEDKLGDVNSKQVDAYNVQQSFIAGDETDIHKVMISMEEAKISLDLAVQVRNKLLEAYQEISRIQL